MFYVIGQDGAVGHESPALLGIEIALARGPIAVHLRVAGSKRRHSLFVFRPSKNLPFGSTADGESPMSYHPFGGATIVHLFVLGS